MRIGIMDMQMDALIPTGKPPQEIMASLMQFDHAALALSLFENGFNPIELGGDLGMFLPQSYSPETIQKLLALKKEKGVTYTCHLPLWSVEPSTPLTPVRHGSTQAMVDIIKATLPLEIESYVLHATGALAAEFYQMRLPDIGKSIILRQFQSGAMESIQTLLRETGIASRWISIETVEFPFDLTFELVEQMDTSVCLDVGHVLSGFPGDVELFDVLEKVLPRLGEVHLHDSPYAGSGDARKVIYDKDHSVLGTGALDVHRLLKRLQEARPTVPIIFELRVSEALESLDYIRKVYPQALA